MIGDYTCAWCPDKATEGGLCVRCRVIQDRADEWWADE